MSEMIERVAMAILGAMDLTDGLDAISADTYARAAIEAMREPDETMLWAHELPDIGPDEIRALWQAMIDAALKDKP